MLASKKDHLRMVVEAQSGANIFAMLDLYQKMPASDAIGAACAVLIECAYNHQEEFRRAMREPVHKDGFIGIPLLEVFRRQSQ